MRIIPTQSGWGSRRARWSTISRTSMPGRKTSWRCGTITCRNILLLETAKCRRLWPCLLIWEDKTSFRRIYLGLKKTLTRCQCFQHEHISGTSVFTSSICLSLASSGPAMSSRLYLASRSVWESNAVNFITNPGLFYSGPPEESRTPAWPLLGKPPPLSHSLPGGDQLSHQQKVCQDEEKLCWTFQQIVIRYFENSHCLDTLSYLWSNCGHSSW